MSLLLKVKNKHLRYALLSLSAALLLSFSFEPWSLFPLSFLGMIPLLELENQIRKQEVNGRLWIFLYSWLALFLWNAGTVWWIWNATSGGAIAAFLINSLPLVFPFFIMHIRSAKTGKQEINLFISAWLLAELLQFHWDLAFPWLILGNVFSVFPDAVQWIEFTGVLGASFWILLVNSKVYKLLKSWKDFLPNQRNQQVFRLAFFYLFCPLLFSWIVLDEYQKEAEAYKTQAHVLVVQPNIDPYGEKFEGMTPGEQLEKMIQLTEQNLKPETQFVLFPETALQGSLNENLLEQEALIMRLSAFLKFHPTLSILSGADSYKIYQPGDALSPTARYIDRYGITIDNYNTAFYLEASRPIEIYHKNKMVPGVEKMPYPQLFGFLEKIAINLGGTSGSLGSDGESRVFESRQKIKLAPVICYESVFPEFMSSYVAKGADILCIITNDGWWGNTPGYKQHFSFARLRAIESRRAIARSANTGISGFISDEGKVLAKSAWWEPAALSSSLRIGKKETFFVRNAGLIRWLIIIAFFNYFSASIFAPKFRFNGRFSGGPFGQ